MKFILLITFVLLSILSFGQTTDSITIRQNMGQNFFYQNNKKIKNKAIKALLVNNNSAYKEYKIARKKLIYSGITGGIGGFLTGFNVGLLVNGEPLNPLSLLGGFGLIATSIVLTSSYNTHTSQAIHIYNSNLH